MRGIQYILNLWSIFFISHFVIILLLLYYSFDSVNYLQLVLFMWFDELYIYVVAECRGTARYMNRVDFANSLTNSRKSTEGAIRWGGEASRWLCIEEGRVRGTVINVPLVNLCNAIYCRAFLFLSCCILPRYSYYFQVKDRVRAERGRTRRRFYLYFVKLWMYFQIIIL